jgi:alpha-glucosidase
MTRHSSIPLFLLTLLLSLPTHAQPPSPDPWYNHAVIYEIYPRSFQDSNGDGLGDLNGVTQRLPYLESLGVDAIWIAPMYPSPQVDFGYDISNYTAVDPQYGTLADFDHLLTAAKAHHIRILLDMVLNHTSSQHPWFLDSASSRTNPHADWYIWNDGIPAPKRAATSPPGPNEHQGPNGWVVPPNNWSSLFQGSAWEWVPARGQFYYHFFYKQQPDLNWRNPAVEKAMFDAMRFWLDRGVAGFRLDAIDTLFEDPTLKNEPLTGRLDPSGFPEADHSLTSNLPEVHGVLRRMRAMIDSYAPASSPEARVLVGEIYGPSTAALLPWYGTPAAPELQLPMDTIVGFHREGGGQPNSPNVSLNLAHFRSTLTEMESNLGSNQPLLVFDNHDNPRSWDRFADPANRLYDPQIARLITTILYTTRATALTYYGAEIGMTTHPPTRREDVRDPIGITGWPQEKGRDGERTPMQWTATPPDFGFSTSARTWLPLGADSPTVNVATEAADPNSLLNWNRTLIAIRARNPTMHDGGITMLDPTNPAVLSYVRMPPNPSVQCNVCVPDTPEWRAANAHPIVVSLNFTAQPQTVHLDLHAAGITSTSAKPLLADAATLQSRTALTTFTLPPYATLIAEVQ